jgi:AGCS family alanine or glycine:cation symporter
VLDFGDYMILGMAFPNLLGVFLLSGKVRRELDAYWTRYKAGEFPVYK